MTEVRLPQNAWSFEDEILVECPRCAGCAVIHSKARGEARSGLTCTACGFAPPRISAQRSYQSYQEGRDPYYQLPLWLRESVGGEVVWAYNWRHFEDLEFFLNGTWRMHRTIGKNACGSPRSYRTRLPRWMHLQSNRPQILRALKRIKARRLR